MGHIGTQTKKHKLCLMYKIIKKMTPTYPHNLLPQPSQHTYATRNINNLKHIKCRTSRYRNSFLPSTILAWNKLPTNIKESATINIFKTICSEKTEKPQYKHICTGPEYRHHTRIRLGLSALNQQRFTYNLIETKFCDNCRDKDESPKHYFLESPQYEIFRITLLRQLQTLLLPDLFQNKKKLLNVIIHVNSDDRTTNIKLCSAIHTFIANTGRFSK